MIPADRFSNRVDDYVRARPCYPGEIVGWLAETFGLERLLSSSYVPAAGHPRHEPMLAALEALFRAYASRPPG